MVLARFIGTAQCVCTLMGRFVCSDQCALAIAIGKYRFFLQVFDDLCFGRYDIQLFFGFLKEGVYRARFFLITQFMENLCPRQRRR